MAIPVKCPECAYRFHVELAFAGRPGRCPECDALIDVPAGPNDDFDDETDDEFGSKPAVGEFSSASRRAVRPPTVRNESREQPRFDPSPRIDKWKRVAGGFRNLAIAAGLIAIDTLIRATFNLMNGLPNDGNQMTSAQKALMVGNALFTALAITLWAVGRVGLAKTPYLPASGTAKTSAVMAVMTAIPGVLGVCCAAAGIVVAADNLLGGMVLIQLGGCGVFVFGLGWIVAEIVGLLAQIRITGGLEASGASRLAKVHLGTFISGVCLSMIAFCGFVIAISAMVQKAEQARQAQQGQQGQGQAKNPPFVGQGKIAGPGNPAANPKNPPPPPINLEEHKDTIMVIMVVAAASTIGFALLCVWSFLSAQGAVRKEIQRLTYLSEGRSDDDHYNRYAMGD